MKQPKPKRTPPPTPPQLRGKVKKKAEAKYVLKDVTDLDHLVNELPYLPPLPIDAPILLPRKDIRNAQDLDNVKLLWRGKTAPGVDAPIAWDDEWRKDAVFAKREGQTLSINSHRSV